MDVISLRDWTDFTDRTTAEENKCCLFQGLSKILKLSHIIRYFSHFHFPTQLISRRRGGVIRYLDEGAKTCRELSPQCYKDD